MSRIGLLLTLTAGTVFLGGCAARKLLPALYTWFVVKFLRGALGMSNPQILILFGILVLGVGVGLFLTRNEPSEDSPSGPE